MRAWLALLIVVAILATVWGFAWKISATALIYYMETKNTRHQIGKIWKRVQRM